MLPIYKACIKQSSEDIYQQQLTQLSQSTHSFITFAVLFEYKTYYLPCQKESHLLQLCAVFSCHKRGDVNSEYIDTFCSVFESSQQYLAELKQLSSVLGFQKTKRVSTCYDTQPRVELIDWLAVNKSPLLNINKALFLQPTYIEKPWGQEIWFTGIEARGQSLFADPNNTDLAVALPWLLDLLPNHFKLAFNHSPILLKVLDPIADEVFGDLYFEMHQQKQEVYIVTAIDKTAWPDGIGRMRFGFDKNKIATFDTVDLFKQAFEAIVRHYQETRDKIDQQIDKLKQLQQIPVNQAVSLALMKQWLALLPSELIATEKLQRAEIETYIGCKNVAVGDVIKIPFNTPHSLMHGIRTIEFQTPVYERKIICFWQKVLTQNHWDTEEALGLVNFDYQDNPDFEVITENGLVKIDKIVDYPEFEVLRYHLQAGASELIYPFKRYALLSCVTNQIQIDDIILQAEQSCLITASSAGIKKASKLINPTSSPVVCLLALPKEPV